MKYGILFSTAGVLLAALAVVHAHCYFLLLWPALSFGLVGLVTPRRSKKRLSSSSPDVP
jgi:thiosulfate reductase cytochrome b subunit